MTEITDWTGRTFDSGLYLELQDLTSILTNNAYFTFDYGYGSFIDLASMQVIGSSFWDVPNENIKRAGYRTDVFLRTTGTVIESDIAVLKDFFKIADETNLSRFSIQLVTCMEELRLENIVQAKRPGTKRDFAIRKKEMKHFFHTQLKNNVIQGHALDELFCLIYLQLHADEPNPDFSQAEEAQLQQLEDIRAILFETFSADSTRDITNIGERLIERIHHKYDDMVHEYFAFPIKKLESYTERTVLDELTRTDPLANEVEEEVDEEDNEYFDQSFSTWHRENENSDRKQNMLQFELDVGTKTDLMGGNTRETEEGNEATASVQGDSGESDQNDYSQQEPLPKKEGTKRKASESTAYGSENQYAVVKIKDAVSPSAVDKDQYKEYLNEIDPFRRRLASTIEKALEHKRNAPHKNLQFGRLSKNLLPLVIDDSPRIFYKKTFESNEVDAAFTLLVDCSASMFNKMEETKKAIVLFHEVLQQLHIPHTIVGFWEDANEGTKEYQPNYFHYVHRFHDSFYGSDGARIMQLEPEEDNRDGFSIRIMTEEMEKRKEKNRFLLVFSDGEPAAINYEQNGIVDTNVAVREARKKGIDVIGMYLSDGDISDQEEEMMKNIYGKGRLMIPDVAELSDHFAPLLKRLILRGI